MLSNAQKLEEIARWAPMLYPGVKSGQININGIYSLAARRRELARRGKLDARYCRDKRIIHSAFTGSGVSK